MNFKKTIVTFIAIVFLINTCSAANIDIRVLDNLNKAPGTVDVYKNNQRIMTINVPSEGFNLKNLEYGTYRFEVTSEYYETWSYDAFPCQENYDTKIGNVELTSERNTVSYIIRGDYTNTEGSGFDNPSTITEKIYGHPLNKYIPLPTIGLEFIGFIIVVVIAIGISKIQKEKDNKK